jgi:endonuclease YncB( thermonuclease family)
MAKPPSNNSFTPLMKFWLLVLMCGVVAGKSFAQERVVEGIVYDKNSKERIAKVNIVNSRTKQSVYNTLKAEFKLTALAGDQLVVNKIGYFSDTVQVGDSNTILVYLKPTSIQLRQVNITDSVLNPQKRYLATKQEYSKAYGSNAYRDPLTLTPGLGAGISIDAIWNSFSREGRNAARLQKVIERDFHENQIDYRFNKTLVGNITGLKDPQLSDFMQKYRPGYYMVMNASQYEFVTSIRTNLKRYLRNPKAYSLQRLE